MFAKAVGFGSLILFAFGLAAAAPLADSPRGSEPASDGIVTGRSAYAMDETIDRLKRGIANKGITFFTAIDQSELAAKADIKLRPSTLLVFGNPALGRAVHNFQSRRGPRLAREAARLPGRERHCVDRVYGLRMDSAAPPN